MPTNRRLVLASAIGAPFVLSRRAGANGFPTRPVRLVVGFPPGGATDGSARVIAEYLGQRYGTPVVVENRPGASGAIAGESVARAAPDGHTWLIASQFALTTGHLLNPRLAYSPVRDLTPASMVFTTDHVLTVNGSMEARDFPEFLAEAKRRGMTVRYGVTGMGTTSHLMGELLRQQTGVDLAPIPYRGLGVAVTDQLAGTIEAMIDQLPSAMPHLRGGRIRALAVTGAARNAALPEVATIAETLPGYEAQSWNAIALPAQTPRELLERISADIREALAAPASQTKLAPLGADYKGTTPDETAAILQADAARWEPVIRSANISAG